MKDELVSTQTCCNEVKKRVRAATESIQGALNIVDVIADLLHLAEAEGLGVDDILRLARFHWSAERHGGKDHGE